MRLSELGHTDVACITLATAQSEVQAALAQADFVFHLAGVNRPQDPAAPLQLVYVDDVVAPQYSTTVGELAQTLQSFADSRATLLTPPVGTGLVRALYSTYISYLSPEKFAYPVPQHADPRGVFVEVLKTPDCGQFSYFTAHPGITRGGHYHHSKTEKFLVMRCEGIGYCAATVTLCTLGWNWSLK